MAETRKKSASVAKNASKKAVISTGGKQYLVSEGDELEVELLEDKSPAFEALLLIDDQKITVGTPAVNGAQVRANVLEPEVKQDKVTAIRFKAKKRVHKRRGHRQKLTRIKITKIG